LSNVRTGISVTVNFKNYLGDTLASYNLSGSDESASNGVDAYFGYGGTPGSAATGVASIEIIRVATSNGGTLIGFDDFGFTDASPIPEPSAAAFLVGVSAAGFAALRRRRR